MNAEGRRAPSPHPSPKCNPHCHNNKNLGHSSPGDEGDCPPTRTRQQQPSFPKLVQDAASRAAAPLPKTPRPAQLTCPEKGVHVRVGGSSFLRCPLRGVHDWGRASAGSRGPAKPGAEGCSAPCGRRARGAAAAAADPEDTGLQGRAAGRPGRQGSGRGRRGSLRQRRAEGWGRLPPAPPWSPFSGGAGRLRSGRGRGTSCLGACSPSAAAAGSPPRPSACLYCSALLGSLYFSSSLPPSLSLYLLPPSLDRPLALSLPPSLALWLPLWLPPPPPPPPRNSSPGSRSSFPANNDPGSAELN